MARRPRKRPTNHGHTGTGRRAHHRTTGPGQHRDATHGKGGRDTKQRKRNKIDLMRRGRPSVINPTGDPLVKKVKSCGPGSTTRAYTFLIDDNSCLWGKRYGSDCRSSGRCISRETAAKHARIRGENPEYNRLTGGGDPLGNAHAPRSRRHSHNGDAEIQWRERWIGRRDTRPAAGPYGPTNRFRGT